MKKIIGVLGVAVIAATMFFSSNTVSGSKSDTSLASLIAVNTANAEIVQANGCHYTGIIFDYCQHNGWTIQNYYSVWWGSNCAYNI